MLEDMSDRKSVLPGVNTCFPPETRVHRMSLDSCALRLAIDTSYSTVCGGIIRITSDSIFDRSSPREQKQCSDNM